MNEPRFTELLDRYFDRALALGEKAELEAMLRASAAARSAFWKRARLHAALRQLTQRRRGQRLALRTGAHRQPRVPRLAPGQTRPVVAVQPVRRPGRFRSARWMAGTLALLVIGFAVVFWPPRRLVREAPRLARVVHVVPVGKSTASCKQGDVLRQGPLNLESGVVQLELTSGVQVVVQGPSQLDLVEPQKIRLLAGRVTAEVPGRARGFTMEIPGGRVVDLGTRFGVAVQPGGLSAIHVFDGKLQAAPGGSEPVALHAGEAIEATAGKVTRKRADESQFPRASRVIAGLLVGGDFEPGTRIESKHVPTKFGYWGGEPAYLVAGPVAGVTPHQGRGMLNFSSPGPTNESPEQWQLVDLHPAKQLARGAPMEATFSARFNRAAHATSYASFGVTLASFRGKPDRAPWFWARKREESLAFAAPTLVTDLDPTTWEPIVARINVSLDADFLLVQVAGNAPKAIKGFDSGQDAHFVDSATLEVRILPKPGSAQPGLAP